MFIFSVDGQYTSVGKLGAAILGNHANKDVSIREEFTGGIFFVISVCKDYFGVDFWIVHLVLDVKS